MNYFRGYNLPPYLSFLIIILSSLFFSSIFFRQFDIGKALVFKSGIAFILICFSVRGLLKNNSHTIKNDKTPLTYSFPFLIPIAFYILICIVSTVLSISPWMSFLGAYERQIGLLGILSCIGLYWFFVSSTYKNYLLILKVLIITASIISIHAIIQFFGFFPFGQDDFVKHSRVGSFLGHPNYLGHLLAFSSPLHIYFIFNNTTHNKLIKLFWVTSLLLQSTALFMSKTRGAYVAVFISILVFSFLLITFYTHKKKINFVVFCFTILLLLFFNSSFAVFHLKKTIPMIIGGGCFFLFLFIYLFYVRKIIQLGILKLLSIFLILSFFSFGSAYKLYSIKTKGDVYTYAARYFSIYDFGHPTPRYNLWSDTIKTIDNVPFFGIGIDTFRQFFMPYKSEELERQEPNANYDNPHSNYLYYLICLGPLGLLVYLFILYRFLFINYRIITNKEENIKNRLLGLSFFISFVSYLIWSIPGFDFLISMIYFWSIMATFSIWFRSISHSYQFKFIEYRLINIVSLRGKTRLLQKIVMILAIPTCLYSGYAIVKIARADYFFMIGTNHYNSNNFQKALVYYKKAVEENPRESFYYQNLAKLYTSFAGQTKFIQDRLNYILKSEQAIKKGLKNSWAPENLYIIQLQGRMLLGDKKMIEKTARKVLSFSPHLQAIKDILNKVTKNNE